MYENELYVLFEQLDNLKKCGQGFFPRTEKLLSSGREKLAKKVGEEAVEVVISSISDNKKETILESADLLYNLVALWVDMDITPESIFSEMANRRNTMGVAEKLPKVPKKNSVIKSVSKEIKTTKKKQSGLKVKKN